MLLIFDLDGTLIDSRLDLAHAVNATRVSMRREPLPNELIYTYVGNGARVLIERAMGTETTSEEIDDAHSYFVDYYSEHALDKTTLYSGVTDTLHTLRTDGHQMAVLTNKPVRISHHILKGLGIDGYFFEVLGGNSLEFKKPHPIGIETIRSAAGASKKNTWMIGDSAVDIETARNAGVASCGLTYGFQPESLHAMPPDLLADDLATFVAHLRSLPA